MDGIYNSLRHFEMLVYKTTAYQRERSGERERERKVEASDRTRRNITSSEPKALVANISSWSYLSES